MSLSDINRNDLNHFLRLRAFGNLETNAQPLTSEQQTQLFDMVSRLVKYQMGEYQINDAEWSMDEQDNRRICLKGIWPILTLCFNNRSGLILMTMFYNSTTMTKLSIRKFCDKTLQILQNPNINIHNIKKILLLLGVQQSVFLEQFNTQMREIKRARRQKQLNSTKSKHNFTLLEGERIFNRQQYDSQPDIELSDINNENLFQNHSMICLQDHFVAADQTVPKTENIKEQNTIKRKVQVFRPFVIGRTNRTSRRPNRKQRKNKLRQHKKKQQIFVSLKRDKQKLRKMAQFMDMSQSIQMKLISNQDDDDRSEAPCRHRRIRTVRQPRSARKRNQVKQNQSIRFNRMDEQSFIVSDEDFEQEQNQHNQIKKKDKLKNKLRKMHILSDQQIDEQNRYQMGSIDNQQVFNESIKNIDIKVIKFPTSTAQFIEQIPQLHSSHWLALINSFSNSDKQAFGLIRDIVKNKQDLSFEQFAKIIVMGNTDFLQKYVDRYIRGILLYKMVKVLATIINEVINILYTVTGQQASSQGLLKHCKSIIFLCNAANTNQQFDKIHALVKNSMNSIYEDLRGSSTITQSMIYLQKPKQVISKEANVRLKDDQFVQSVIIALEVLKHGFLCKIFPSETHSMDQQTERSIVQRVELNPSFLVQICKVYSCYDVPINQQNQFQRLISLTSKLNLSLVSGDFLCEYVICLIRMLVAQKKKEKQFNIKPLLSRIVRNDLLKRCREMKTQAHLMIGLKTFETLLQFQQFHIELTANEVINLMKQIDISQKYEKQFLLTVLKLLVQCYGIKSQESMIQIDDVVTMLDRGELRKKTAEIQKQLSEFLRVFCFKYSESADRMVVFQQLKLKKYEQIIKAFISSFIQNKQYCCDQFHFTFSLQLIIEHIWTLIGKLKRDDTFSLQLSQIVRIKILQYHDVIQKLQSRLEIRPLQVMEEQKCESDSDQIADFFFTKQIKQTQIKKLQSIRANKIARSFVSAIGKLMQKMKISQKIDRQFLSFQSMKDTRQSVHYQTYGCMIALSLMSEQNLSPLQNMVVTQIKIHSLQIKIQKTCKPYQLTNKLVLSFLNGFFKSLRMLPQSEIDQQLNKCGLAFKQSVLDILFMSLTCDSDRETVSMCQQFFSFERIQHILTFFYQLNSDRKNSKTAYPDIDIMLRIVAQNAHKINRLKLEKMMVKFGNKYNKVLIDLFGQCQGLQWKKMKQRISLSLLKIFIFLLRVDASQTVLKQYKPYFAITDYKSAGKTNSMLKQIDSRDSINTVCIIELFRLIKDKRKESLIKTVHQYFNYIVHNDIQQFHHAHSSDSRKQVFERTQIMLSVLWVEAGKQKMTDYFCLQAVEQLLVSLLCQSFLTNNSSEGLTAVTLFFNLFAKYPTFSDSYMRVLKNHHAKIDMILKQQNNSSVQEAIKQYVVNKNCNFEQLHSILWYRSQQNFIDRKPTRIIEQIIQQSILYLNTQSIQKDEIVERFKQLKHNLKYNQEAKTSIFEQIIQNSNKSNTISNTQYRA